MPPVSIRPATEADVPLILAFIRELAEYERLPHEVVATEDGLRRTMFGPRPEAEVLLADLDGGPVGLRGVLHDVLDVPGPLGHPPGGRFVRPAARGRGVGRALLAEVARIAVARGSGRLEWSVLDWNESAIGFYRGLGARPMDEWTVYRLDGEGWPGWGPAGRMRPGRRR